MKKIQQNASELQTNGVARREVRYRVTEAEQLLYESLQDSKVSSQNKLLDIDRRKAAIVRNDYLVP
ncbi:hypothetical protein IQ255_07130 [Pleurocapsales cyanobacterium LEGE 10410]|nr:hypothetical protein [Pleurocapsales cyanobacterium LEGE 10410]